MAKALEKALYAFHLKFLYTPKLRNSNMVWLGYAVVRKIQSNQY